jgi:hypothetical protein
MQPEDIVCLIINTLNNFGVLILRQFFDSHVFVLIVFIFRLQQVGIVTEEAQRSLTQFSLLNETQTLCGFGANNSIYGLFIIFTF